MRLILSTCIFILLSTFTVSAQKQKKDSLLKIINSNKHDTSRVKAFSSLCNMTRFTDQDTSFYYGKESLKLAQKIKWNKGISNSYKNLGILKFETGQYEEAIGYYMHSLKIDEKHNDKRGMAANYNHIGSVYQEQNRFDKAEEYYFKSLHLREQLNDQKGIAASYNNIGLVYYNMNDYNKALEYYSKSLKMKEYNGDKYNIAGGYNNIGMVHSAMGNTKLALEYYRKSLTLREEINDKKGIAAVLGNISILHNELADSAKTITEKKHHSAEAIKYGLKCLQISEEINALLWKNKTAEELIKAYKGIENYQKALDFAELFISTNDSLFRDDKIKAITEIDVKYQTEKKEQLIELQKIQIEKKEAETEHHRILIYLISGGLLLVLLLLIFTILAYRQKRKANILLIQQKHEIEEKNEELNQQKEEIMSQRDEIESQKNQILERNVELNQKNEEIEAQRDFVIKQGDILSKQNEILEYQKREITDSIVYARRIQQVLLPKDEVLTAAFKENFILFKPRDIVSGDFYWIQQINNNTIFCVADCTGHGVPGAFMSMLGISFLNEIIRNKEHIKASQILDKLRKYIIDSLHQEGNTYEQKDGMDISLCILNSETLELQYAGANSPCWIISSRKSAIINHQSVVSNRQPVTGNHLSTGSYNEHYQNEGEDEISTLKLFELKPDKMPIGFHEKQVPFTNTSVQLIYGDTVYLFSDGFADQFGGEKETKFKLTSLKELLLSASSKSLQEQCNILNTTIENWMHIHTETKIPVEQTDDITIIGLKI